MSNTDFFLIISNIWLAASVAAENNKLFPLSLGALALVIAICSLLWG